MALPTDNVSMAVYCDFENVALGVRDAKYKKFDIKPVLERLLLKGSIVLKKAYCDWDRYKDFKPQMHEASFELIEIPHVRQSGKNSADIRLVVDALDLCYTKAHVNTFVIISGDSDFSPLVSKLRENAKYVVGVGVKNSTSDLLIANCDEFIFIDDLLRESRHEAAAKRESRQTRPVMQTTSGEEPAPKEDLETRKTKAVGIASETFEALLVERGDGGKIWASALKQAIKRRRPDFNEAYYGFKTFGNLLEEAQLRGLMDIGRDDKSGAYVYRSSPAAKALESKIEIKTGINADEPVDQEKVWPDTPDSVGKTAGPRDDGAAETAVANTEAAEQALPKSAAKQTRPKKQNTGRGRQAKSKAQENSAAGNVAEPATLTPGETAAQPAHEEAAAPAPARKSARGRRPRKSEAVPADTE
jgi:uncharacterized LabA/DUF88 family protein